MPWVYEGHADTAFTSDVTSITIDISAAGLNPAANSVLVGIVSVGGGGDSFTATTTNGYTRFIQASTGNIDGYGCYWKLAAGTHPDDDFDPSWTDNGRGAAMVFEISGLDTSSPLDVYNNTADTLSTSDVTTVTSRSVTPTSQPGVAVALGYAEENHNWSSANFDLTTGFGNKEYRGASVFAAAMMGTRGYTSTASQTATNETTGSGCKADCTIACFKEPGGGGGPTAIPPRMHNIMRQHMPIIAHRLGGMIQ